MKYKLETTMELSKTLSPLTLLCSSIAGIVGSGWLLSPLVSARIAGPASIITWLIAGLMMMVVATTFVKLSKIMPLTGGTVRFFQMSHGHFAGFGFSFIAWLGWVAVSPIETMALLQYSAHYIPHIMTAGVSPVLTDEGMMIAVLLVSIISIINNYGVRVYSKVNSFILMFKIIIPATTVVLLLCSHYEIHNVVSTGGFMPYGVQSIFKALPLAGIIYCFIGFNPAIQMAAEAKSTKAIPIAIYGSLLVCIVLYTMIQAAFVMAIPSPSIAHGWQNLSFVGDTAPFVGLLSIFGLVFFVKALFIDAAVSPFGTALVQSMATSRLTYAMAENGYFPKALMKLNKHGSPTRAIIVNTIVGAAFFLPFPSWQHMVAFLSISLVMGYVAGPMSLMILSDVKASALSRFKKVKTHGLCVIALYICNLMIFWSGWAVVAKIATVFSLGYVILAVMMMTSKKARQEIGPLNITRGFWVILYMAGITALSYLSSFGGDHVIPFGMDFVVMAVFTIMVYGVAYTCARITVMPINSRAKPVII